MAGKGSGYATELLELIFQALPITELGGNLYVSLHTADPGPSGDQTTNEATYTSYARVAVVRTSSGWSISGATTSNAIPIIFPTCTGGSNTLGYFGIGTAPSGAGILMYSGAINFPLAVVNGVTPGFAVGGVMVTED